MAMAANAVSAVARATISWLNTLFREILQFMFQLIFLHKSSKMLRCHSNRVGKDLKLSLRLSLGKKPTTSKALNIFPGSGLH